MSKLRVTKAVRMFMALLASRESTQVIDHGGPWPTVQTLLKMEKFGLFTTETVNKYINKRGQQSGKILFTITPEGRTFSEQHPV